MARWGVGTARALVHFTVSGERRSWVRLVALIFREPSRVLAARERARRARGGCWSVEGAPTVLLSGPCRPLSGNIYFLITGLPRGCAQLTSAWAVWAFAWARRRTSRRSGNKRDNLKSTCQLRTPTTCNICNGYAAGLHHCAHCCARRASPPRTSAAVAVNNANKSLLAAKRSSV
jgi:hypothetical protein